MSKHTVSADGGAASAQGLKTRRAALAALAGVPALAILPAVAREPALDTDSADDRALALWERRHTFRQPILDAERRVREAKGRMPAWALPGPRFIDFDGSAVGGESHWPAVEGIRPSGGAGRYRVVRPDPGMLRMAFDSSSAILGRENALPKYRQELRELARRVRAQKSEEERTGLAAANRAASALSAQAGQVEDEIMALAPATPNAAAARILVEAMSTPNFQEPVSASSAMTVAAVALEHLRPALRGIIKAHVDEILDNPGRRLGSCQAYVGDSGVESEEAGA
jgi:hypothetical protein